MVKGSFILHDSRDSNFRNPVGAVPCSQKIIIKIEITDNIKMLSVILRTWIDGYGEKKIEMDIQGKRGEYFVYEAGIITPLKPCLLWYYFIINENHKTYFYGNNTINQGGRGEVYELSPNSYQITVYKDDYKTPDWFKDSVMYQIFVDRFYNGNDNGIILNKKEESTIHDDWYELPEYHSDSKSGEFTCRDFFGGNLPGIIKKLSYLKELGIDVIYLNPIFESPSNHKYNTSDYMKIDSMFGDNKIFKSLCQNAAQLDIRVILDGVFSHTGSDSIYFNSEGRYTALGAYQSQDSPYYSWYRFKNHPHEYECWWGIKTLPNVNEMEASYRKYILNDRESVIKYWMAQGVKGWRLDVADELPDEFIKELRSTVKEIDNDAVIIGEVWEDASNKLSYDKMREYLLGEELDSTMNYPFRNMFLSFLLGQYNGMQLNNAIMCLYENYPRESFYSLVNLVGSHDTSRIKTILGGGLKEGTLLREEEALYNLSPEQQLLSAKRIKIFSLVQMTFPGVPCIYYGDEAGLEGCRDPFNRKTYPWGREDKELIEWYKKLIFLRHHIDALRTGDFLPVYQNNDIYGYVRIIQNNFDVFGHTKANGFVLILLNRNSDMSHRVNIDLSRFNIRKLYDLLNNEEICMVNRSEVILDILPLEGRLICEL